jgi:predicted TIM-barrel fold metal-dependent hydrolase
MSVFDEPKIDCHVHVFDPSRFPYRDDTPYRPTGQEVGTTAQLIAMLDAYGVRQALYVQPNSGYFIDNACMLDALAHHPGRLKGTAVVAHDTDAAALQRLKEAGVIGVAINTPMFGTEAYRDLSPLAARLRSLEMLLEIQVQNDDLLALLPVIEATGVRVLVDHCGRPAPERGIDQPGFRALLDLGRTGRAVVKLGGEATFSRLPFPHEDAWPYQRALLHAFTPDLCVWGSNWPFLRATERIDYGPLLVRLAALLPDAADRRKVLWETPRRVFGFHGER